MNDPIAIALQIPGITLSTDSHREDRWLSLDGGIYTVYRQLDFYDGIPDILCKTTDAAVAIAVLISGRPTEAKPTRWLIAVPDKAETFFFEIWEEMETSNGKGERLRGIYYDASVALDRLTER